MDADFAALQELFKRLSHGSASRLEEEAFVDAHGGLRVELACREAPGRWASSKRLRRVQAGTPAFSWRQTSDEWDAAAELMDGLLHSAKPGHQYLSDGPGDDAVVVVSRGEGSRSVREDSEQPRPTGVK